MFFSKNNITAVRSVVQLILKVENRVRLLSLYTQDAVIESPLIPHLLGTKNGVCRGQKEFRVLLEIVVKRKPKVRTYHRNKFFTDGKTLMWEYPRATPTGEQMDFVEVMDLENGLIARHRIYWGWFGVNTILEDKYRNDPL